MHAPDAAPSPVVAEIDLSAVRHNARVLMRRARPARLMAVVKADAYGHGALPVARALRAEGVRRFAVARLGEAVALREGSLRDPILLLEAPLPHHLPAYARHGLEVTISSVEAAEAVIAAAREAGTRLRAHVKIETGLNRIGLMPEEAAPVLRRLAASPHVALAGVWTHLASAGDPAQQRFTRQQVARLRAVIEALPPALADALARRVHAANSAALLNGALEGALEDMLPHVPAFTRAGIALYGAGPTQALAEAAGLRPAMRLAARVTHVKTIAEGGTVSYGRTWAGPRPTRLATVGAGYADGYARRLGGVATLGLGGRHVPVVGAVCMDMLMADLGPPGGAADAIRVGDEAVLFGAGGPSVFDVARWAETLPYEVCCAVAARVPRRYLPEA